MVRDSLLLICKDFCNLLYSIAALFELSTFCDAKFILQLFHNCSLWPVHTVYLRSWQKECSNRPVTSCKRSAVAKINHGINTGQNKYIAPCMLRGKGHGVTTLINRSQLSTSKEKGGGGGGGLKQGGDMGGWIRLGEEGWG